MLQLALMMFYMHQKSGYHIDELWSYGLSNSANETYFYPLGFRPDVNDAQYNQWIEGQRFFQYLTVQKHQKFAYAKVYQNQENDVHPPLYYFAIHSICSMFPDTFNKWYGLALNILIFIFAQILLYAIANNFLKSRFLALATVLLYGFGMSCINNFVFIRMYTMLSLFTLTSIYLHLELLKGRPHLKTIGIITFLGGLTHYHFFVCQFFLSLITTLFLFYGNALSKALRYASSVLTAVACVFLFFPKAYFHMFHSVRGLEATTGVSNLSVFELYLFFQYALKYIFGFTGELALTLACALAQFLAFVFYLALIFGIVALIAKLFKISLLEKIFKKLPWLSSITKDKAFYFIYVPILIFAIVITPMISPDIGCFEGRYFFQFYPLLCLAFVGFLNLIFNKFLKLRGHKPLVIIACLGIALGSNLADEGDFILNARHQFNRHNFAEIVKDKTCVYVAPQDYFIHSMCDLFMYSKQVLPTRYKEIDLGKALAQLNALAASEEVILIIPRDFAAEALLEAVEAQTSYGATSLGVAVNHMDLYSLYSLKKS